MRALPLLLVLLALAACEPAEKRAEGHYQRALAYLAEGDRARAAVEFRNVFRLDGGHTAARLAYARLLAGGGDREAAMGQYLRLVEQDPQNPDGHRELAEIALELGDGETAAFHTAQAFRLAPADPRTRALKASLDWRRAGPRDTAGRAAAVAMAAAVAAEAPEVLAAQMLLVTDRLAAGDPAAALARADAALAVLPEDPTLHLARLAALERLAEQSGDPAAVGATLRDMAARFPADSGVRDALLQWHLRQGDPAGAEAVLRAAADAAAPGEAAPALDLVTFLLQTRGPGAARAELDARIAAAGSGGAAAPFRRAAAGIDFAAGRQAEAIAALRSLLAGATASDATRDLQLALAEMLAATTATDTSTGAAAESAALAAAILAADPGHEGALKLRARTALAEDRPEAAIADLRTLLAGAPRDAEAMTIMAFAHARSGDRDLMGERLARAVEVSDRAPAESLRYAGFLMQDGRSGPAEGVVIDALRRAPADPRLLAALGRIQLARQDWPRAEATAGRLQALADAGNAAAGPLAAAVAARSLAGRGRIAEGLGRLGPDPFATDPFVTDSFETGPETAAALLRAQVAAGDAAGAKAWLDARIAANPDAVPARLLRAELREAAGDAAGAEADLAAAIAAAPARPEAHAARFRLLAAAGRPAAATAALAAGFAAVPAADARPLLMLRAGLREATGDRAGALADYRMIRAADLRSGDGTSDPLVANNLASLLAAGNEPGALEEAFRLARQLRGSPVPQFRDTFGWILVRRGDPGAGLVELEPAAAALPRDGAVQFHRAEALRALGRAAEAREGYARALAANAPALPPALAAAALAAAQAAVAKSGG